MSDTMQAIFESEDFRSNFRRLGGLHNPLEEAAKPASDPEPEGDGAGEGKGKHGEGADPKPKDEPEGAAEGKGKHGDADDDEKYDSPEEAAEALAADFIEDLPLYMAEAVTDHDKLKAEAKAKMLEHIGREMATEGVDLTEAIKRIRRMVGGRLMRAKIRKLRGSEKLAGRLYRRRRKSKIKLVGKRYRRKARTKRRERKRRILKKRIGEGVEAPTGAASEIVGLLTESIGEIEYAEGVDGAHVAALSEAFGSAQVTASLLADFFEEFGEGEDAKIARALDEVITVAESAVGALQSASPDVALAEKRLTASVKAIHRAAQAFEAYKPKDEEGDDDGDDAAGGKGNAA